VKPTICKANPYLVVIILTILGWCIAIMLQGGCFIEPVDEPLPPEPRCSGLSVLTCQAHAIPPDGGATD